MLEGNKVDEFIKIIKELKNKNITFVAELSNGKLFKTSGCNVEIVISELNKDEEFFMDSMIGVKKLGKAGALLLVHANVCGVYATDITNDAIEVLEYFAVEVEYENLVTADKFINLDSNDANRKLYTEAVEGIEDPMEAFQILASLI